MAPVCEAKRSGRRVDAVLPVPSLPRGSRARPVDPKEQLIALYMIQVGDAERIALRNQFRSLVEQAIVK